MPPPKFIITIVTNTKTNAKLPMQKFGRQTKFSFMANQKEFKMNPVILTMTILNAFNFYSKPWKYFCL